jgi:gas vesicle protein
MNFKTFFNGLAYGFILGVLFAPTSGEETRKRIAQKAADIKNSVKEKYNGIADTVKEQYEGAKAKVNEFKEKGEAAAYQDARENGVI